MRPSRRPPELPKFLRTPPNVPPEVLAVVDLDDPDIEYVCESILHLRAAGLDVTDPSVVQLAIAGGHRRAAEVEDDAGLRSYRLDERQRQASEYRQALASWKESTSRVYYARLGNRCKIGYSFDVTTRMSQLQPEELLVTEPGGPDREQGRHVQFTALRVTGEWFRYEGALVDHVAVLRATSTAR